MKRPSCFSARDTMQPQVSPRGLAQDPCPPAAVLPLVPAPVRPGGGRFAGQLLDLLKSLIGKEVLLQVGSLVHKGRLISVDPIILISPEGKSCFVRPDAILAVDF